MCETAAMIRPALTTDIERLQDIEIAAGQPFRAIGMDRIADDDPPSTQNLTGYIERHCAWVSAIDGVVAAYLLADRIEVFAHIEQVSVHPDYGRRGVGAALIEHLDQWAKDHGLTALTLTTFRDVPWNGPYYERLGFHEMTDAPDELVAIRAHETELGLDEWPRIAMVRTCRN